MFTSGWYLITHYDGPESGRFFFSAQYSISNEIKYILYLYNTKKKTKMKRNNNNDNHTRLYMIYNIRLYYENIKISFIIVFYISYIIIRKTKG